EGKIATITFNKPETMNSYDWVGHGEDAREFYAAMDQAEEDDDVTVIRLKGSGRSFGTGQDLNRVGFVYGMGTGQPGERRPSQRTRLNVDRKSLLQYHQRHLLCPKITVAQVHGYCVAGAAGIAVSCDVAIAAENARISFPEQRLAFGGGGYYLDILVHTIGIKRALDLVMTGKEISGKEAADIGMVTKAVPESQLEEEAMSYAKGLSLLPRDAIAMGKAYRHMMYERLGLIGGYVSTYIMHAFGTNVRFEPDEHNFFKARRDKGTRKAFHERDDLYAPHF
ncbi:MAG: enoyl-CoA hydratase/isomerase family protein, partial [Chloroflexi bacterium]|nr:enoyl-CoA hydratase/isomerase family protein [Chloroflexota bacterium]